MKCPDCADAEKQERLGPTNGQPGHTDYRCGQCGRLYSIADDLAEIDQRLVEMKARFNALELEMGTLGREIAETEAARLELVRNRRHEK